MCKAGLSRSVLVRDKAVDGLLLRRRRWFRIDVEKARSGRTGATVGV
jgi:hypothetical protein